MIANGLLQNSATSAAAAGEERVEDKIAQEDRMPLGCRKYNFNRTYLVFTPDMYNMRWHKNIDTAWLRLWILNRMVHLLFHLAVMVLCDEAGHSTEFSWPKT